MPIEVIEPRPYSNCAGCGTTPKMQVRASRPLGKRGRQDDSMHYCKDCAKTLYIALAVALLKKEVKDADV